MELRLEGIVLGIKKLIGDYPKLVRELVPEIIQQETGSCPPVKELEFGTEEARFQICRKILEELVELLEAQTQEQRYEEAGDLMIAFCTLLSALELDIDLLTNTQIVKEEKKGGFDKLILMLEKP